MRDARPVAADLRRLAKVTRPVGKTARRVLESFQQGRGLQRALDYAFYQVAAVNGFDSFGHYLRARLILNTCSRYYTSPVSGCQAKFAASATSTRALSAKAAAAELPQVTATPQPAASVRRPTRSAPVVRPGADQQSPVAAAKPAADPNAPLMDYLFGKDSAK
jgi:hypothetical protein